MTVAPSPFLTCPNSETVLQWLKTCQQSAYSAHRLPIASLCFPIPATDPLTVLSDLAPPGRQCYLDSPAQQQAIAAWGATLTAQCSGPARFREAHQCLETWKQQIYRPFSSPVVGPFFFFSFAFFEDIGPGSGTFAPATVLLPRWQVVSQQQQSWVIANVVLESDTALDSLSREICRQVYQIARVRTPCPCPDEVLPEPVSLHLTPEAARQFKQGVDRALQAIDQTDLQKQVVAHALDIVSPLPWQRDRSLQRLRARHSDCYTFAFSPGPQAHFIGASPERLLSLRQGQLVADALAGSAPEAGPCWAIAAWDNAS